MLSNDTMNPATRAIELISQSSQSEIDIPGSQAFRFNDEDISELVGVLLTTHTGVTRLCLKYHHISDIGVNDICRLLSDGSTITELDLEANSITASGVASIRSVLSSPYSTLKALNLSWNNIDSQGGHDIANLLEVNTSLRYLNLANCGFNYSAIIAIYTALKHNQYIEELNLDRPILEKYDGDICADHLTGVLSKHPSIRKLSVRYHKISDYGVSLLSRSICTNTQICSINFACNLIGVGGAEYLASCIIQNQTLEYLDLSCNHIADEGALAIAKALERSKSLKRLYLQHNTIRMSGLLAIGHALERNNTLQELKLWGNEFNDKSAKLYHELSINRLPYVGLTLDFKTYVVDGMHYVAELSEDIRN